MLAHDEWLKVLKELVHEVASPDEQREKWFGEGPLYSSPTELYNQLFDDYAFDLFYDTYSPSFTNEQRSAWLALKDALDNYGRTMPTEPDPHEVYRDPQWHSVGQIANSWLGAFR